MFKLSRFSNSLLKYKFNFNLKRNFILGIESSCDDTGAAILSEDGTILGEHVSHQTSSRYGGVIPSLAMGLHSKNIYETVKKTLEMKTKSKLENLDELNEHVKYIAVTNRPGLSGSLIVGLKFARYLSRKYQIPLIPIHHMEAHALTPRMVEDIQFPFMVLLISGGHCLLAMAESITKFKLLGKAEDNSPGEVFDKVARMLKINTIRPDLRDASGGKSIEVLASENGNPLAFEMPFPISDERNCRFSFAGFKSHMLRLISKLEKESNLEPDEILPNANDISASFQFGVARHICQRVQRGLDFCEMREFWPEIEDGIFQKTLVVSGGVASNEMIKSSLKIICDNYKVRLLFPEPKYCTDNGVMIAWNGLEKIRAFQKGEISQKELEIYKPENVFDFDVCPRADFGENIHEDVHDSHIKCKWIKIL